MAMMMPDVIPSDFTPEFQYRIADRAAELIFEYSCYSNVQDSIANIIMERLNKLRHDRIEVMKSEIEKLSEAIAESGKIKSGCPSG